MISLIKKLLTVFIVLIILNVGFVWYGQANFEATIKSLGKAFVENNVTSSLVTQKLPIPIKQYIDKANLSQNSYKALAIQFDGEYSPKPSKSMKMHTLALLRPTPDMLLGIRLDSNLIVTFNAIETYHKGQANMQMLLFGIIPTGEFNDEKFARSELARLLAYSIFNPVLLKYENIKYEPLDATHTKATITDGKIDASVIFVSGKSGKIIEVQSSDRFRPIKKKLQKTAWKMKVISYDKFDGLNLPKEVEEIWVEDNKNIIYSKYSLTSAKRL
ncbi:DUF6544 family protein [Hydrogenimonas thermophila]|uniref:DUF6544 family protein n=1 Tax=Hydrogenimonas thermophila TaxID=223786 RepID=UPI0029370596|nr:DUF6544 family protein [Hydrogenimonas thermophila]WOE69897.1 DUF6544 family protein [Hydrogenimonas thermophila]WOE72412.1 DUF6544 family protein [Hydrogenimonas thermophila]